MVATDNVAVSVKDEPAFSAIELAEVDNVTVGALSFSVIVIVTDWVPSSVADPPETVDNCNYSSFITFIRLSSVGVNEAVPVVDPAEIVISDTVL